MALTVSVGLADEKNASTETDNNVAGTRGKYESQSLQRVLKKRGLSLEQNPDGKKIGKLLIENLDVFGQDDGFLKILNFFHVTSKRHTVARESLLQPGDTWRPKIAQESRRRLRDPLFTSYAVVAPVKSKKKGEVDVLVITRDVWSLRLNSVFEFQGSQLSYLFISPAENNVFGYRKHVSFAFEMDQGQISIGPIFRDPNILGTRLQLNGRAGLLYSRQGRDFEGSFSDIDFRYPLWKLASNWGASLTFKHRITTIRDFQGGELRLFDPDETVAGGEIPWIYDWRALDVTTGFVRQMGTSFKHQIRWGHALLVRRPSIHSSVPMDQQIRDLYAANVFPRSERSSSLFVRFEGFKPDFVVYRDLNSYDLSEDFRLGFAYVGELRAARKEFGSERNFFNLLAATEYTFDIEKDGFLRAKILYQSRVQDGDTIDKLYEGQLRFSTPRIHDAFRFVGRFYAGFRRDETANRFFRLGGSNGMRGYEIGAFTGRTQLLANWEVRSMPIRIGFLRAGALAFWDMGDAIDDIGEIRLKHDVGAGIRWLIPQMQPVVFRLDWAIPLNGPSTGFPGRITAGVKQVF